MRNQQPFDGQSRRRFLQMAGAAGAAFAWPRGSDAADQRAVEQGNMRIVTDFCNAWPARDTSKLAPFFADTVVYRVSETSPPITGRDAVLARVSTFFDGADTIEFKILEARAMGPLVFTERIDTFEGPKRHWRFHLAGMFFLKDGRVQEWTDYLIRE